MKRRTFLLQSSLATIGLHGGLANDAAKAPAEAKPTAPTAPTAPAKPSTAKIEKVVKTEEEWRKLLTPEQFRITRKHGTERAFENAYHDTKKEGAYRCICCDQELFQSAHKFDSGTGWPSFYKPVIPEHVGTTVDTLMFVERTEVHCSRCDAHLGHIFEDAPETPTGLRYCINSASLKFVPTPAAKP